MDTNSKSLNNTAVMLVSHGSRLPCAEKTFSEIEDKIIETIGLPTKVGYMKIAEPSIASAVEYLKTENPNLDKILALPVFLAPGIHTNIDIPILLGLEPLETDPRCPDGNYPDNHYLSISDDVDFDGEIELIEPIGAHEYLLEIINKKIEEALADSKLEESANTGVLLVSHGSRLNYNKEFISSVHKMFDEACNYPNTYGFMELVEPNIPTSIKTLLEDNKLDRLVIVPVFIAPGIHTTFDIPNILGLKEMEKYHHEEHDHDHDLEPIEFNGEILYQEPIGADDILIKILKEKIEEKL